MKTYRTLVGVACAAALVLLGAGLALAQSGTGAQLLSPLVVDVAQDVPVEVVLAVPLGDGEVVTVTTPLTVSLALQVRIGGAGVVSAAPATDAPSVAVATVAAAPAGERAELGGVAWRVASVERPGQTLTHSIDDYTTRGQFLVVHLELENTGAEPLDLGQMLYDEALTLTLGDASGRTFAPFELTRSTGEECDATEANPGLPVECFLVFEVPARPGDLSVVVADADGEEIALPLP